MSYSSCDLCGEMLLGYQGSACTNSACANAAAPGDPNPYGKSENGEPYREIRARLYPTASERSEQSHRRAMKRAFKGIR